MKGLLLLRRVLITIGAYATGGVIARAAFMHYFGRGKVYSSLSAGYLVIRYWMVIWAFISGWLVGLTMPIHRRLVTAVLLALLFLFFATYPNFLDSRWLSLSAREMVLAGVAGFGTFYLGVWVRHRYITASNADAP